jgi:hypothetical protein
MILLHVYQLITALIAILVAIVTIRERNFGKQVVGGVVLVMLLLRIFLIK